MFSETMAPSGHPAPRSRGGGRRPPAGLQGRPASGTPWRVSFSSRVAVRTENRSGSSRMPSTRWGWGRVRLSRASRRTRTSPTENGLPDVVVAACVEPADAVVHAVEGREEEDGGVLTRGPERCAHVPPVGIREADVDHHRIHTARRGERRQRLVPVARCDHLMVHGGQHLHQRALHRGIVLTDPDPCHG